MTQYKLAELDTVFLSYDESDADINWNRLKTFNPLAKRIHGVTGFDTAHKLCAEIAQTDRLIVIDGDNWILDDWITADPNSLTIDDTGIETACFSFSSINTINGLVYGNGGVKVWNRETLRSSNTHENGKSTDFCWDVPYYQVDRPLSRTVQNTTAYQAWRSGFREAVKMTQQDGQPRQNLTHTWHSIYNKNLSRLNVWCSVGRDINNGIWAMLGARHALHELMKDDLVQQNINSYAWFVNKWEEVTAMTSGFGPEYVARQLRETLLSEFNFYIPELDSTQSMWFKRTYINPIRSGLMR